MASLFDDNFFVNCICLTVDCFVTVLLYEQYRKYSECLRSLQEAQCFELDTNLKKNVENNNGEIKYAVISGKVQALTSPLISQYVPYLSGVIREKITIERKVKWHPISERWGSVNNDLQQTVNTVPFALCGRATGLFKKIISVEVTEPLTARELVVPSVYDQFHCHHDTVGDAVFGVIRGEKILGIQEVERMLCENETLTAVGKLVIDNNELKIKPPDEGLTYFLTPLSLKALIDKIKSTKQLFEVGTLIMCSVTVALFIYFSSLGFSEIKQRVVRHREKKKQEKERKLRRMADESRKGQGDNLPKCTVCLDNPVEVIILECGHICLCYNCSELVRNLCPVCRNPITRTVSAFLP